MDNKKFMGSFVPRTSFYLWFIFILIIVINVLNWRVAIPAYVLLVFMTYYYIRSNYKRQKELTKYIENLTFNIDSATKDTLLNFPMPLVVIELDGTIIWYNSSFRLIFDGQQLLDRAIGLFIEDLDPGSIIDSNGRVTKEVEVQGRHFTVLGNYIKIDRKIERDEYILMMYLIDNTDYADLKSKYECEKTDVSVIIIDNYDDLMHSMDDSVRPQMLAEIDKKLNSWTSPTNGVLRKYERDKYIYIFEHRYIKEFIEKKFEILDTIKEINLGNKIPVTLSLGFGVDTVNLSDAFNNATACLDIALGRGGDQAVIKTGDNFSFYGGKTRELEKRTRVKARVIAYALRELIDQAPSVFIMGHENADMDALGAAFGIYTIAKNRGKEAFIVLNKANPTIENLIRKIEKTGEYEGLFINSGESLDMVDKKTLIVVVDAHKPSFTECPELLKRSSQVVVIDHHRKGADFIHDAVLNYQETYASSTCEMVTEVLQYVEENIKLKPIEAEALYAGIVLDTKNFTFKTGVRTFEAASYLKKQGVDTVAVKQLFQNDLETYTIISDVVKNVEMIFPNIAMSICPLGLKNPQLIAAKSADQLLSLSGIDAAFVLCSVNDEIYISGRSMGDINVQVILEKLGGGGHLSIAGAQLTGMPIQEAKNKLKKTIDSYFEESQ